MGNWWNARSGIKVEGKTDYPLGNTVTFWMTYENIKITITSESTFLTKKYLKKQKVRDLLSEIEYNKDRNVHNLRYSNIAENKFEEGKIKNFEIFYLLKNNFFLV